MADTETIREVAQALARLDALPCEDHGRRIERHEERLTSMEATMASVTTDLKWAVRSGSAIGSLVGGLVSAVVAGLLVWMLTKGGVP
jgi:hypothetical protein